MKSKSLNNNRTGRSSLIAEIAQFFARPWTLKEAKVFLQGSRNLMEENEQLLSLLRQSKKQELSNRELEPNQKTPTNDSKINTAPAPVDANTERKQNENCSS